MQTTWLLVQTIYSKVSEKLFILRVTGHYTYQFSVVDGRPEYLLRNIGVIFGTPPSYIKQVKEELNKASKYKNNRIVTIGNIFERKSIK